MKDEIKDAITMYGAVLPLMEKVTGKKFAEMIRSVYDVSNPRNGYYHDVVKKNVSYVVKLSNGYKYSVK